MSDTTAPPALPALLRVVEQEWDWFVRALDQAGPEVWRRPTRLTGWTVEDLARHAHWGMILESEGLEHAVSGGSGRAVGLELTGPADGIPGALRSARARLVRALHAAVGSKSPHPDVPMPYGDVPLAMAVQVFAMEAAVHRSDLAHALGHGDGAAGLAPSAVGACAAVLQAFWPALAAGATLRPPAGTGIRLVGETVSLEAGFDGSVWGPLVDEPSVVLSGQDQPLLLFAFGRLPFEEAGLTVTGDGTLAVGFKQLVPGP